MSRGRKDHFDGQVERLGLAPFITGNAYDVWPPSPVPCTNRVPKAYSTVALKLLGLLVHSFFPPRRL
jgi:hypothetical protein